MTGAAGFSLYQFFAPGGVLSKTHPAYEFRRGQLQMAQAVEEALEEKRHPLGQASHHLNRHEKLARAALPQRRSFSGARAFPRWQEQAERLLHEGTQ